MAELNRLCLEYPTWGVMKLRDHFNHADRKIAPRYLRRLLRKMGIMAIYRKPNLSRRNTEHSCTPIYLEDLLLAGQIKFGVLISRIYPCKKASCIW